MRNSRTFLLLCLASLYPALSTPALAAEDDVFLGQLNPPLEQPMGYGRSAIWTLPLVATQYQPAQPSAVMQTALQAQQDGRYLDALITLDDAVKNTKNDASTLAELNLLRASFLLQGNQSQQALDLLAPLRDNSPHAADADALSTMAYLEQGKAQAALDASQQAQNRGGLLACLARSYALQSAGRLADARSVMHDYNTRTPSALTLAREAELALALDQLAQARALVEQARATDGSHPYVDAVSGLVYLLNGQMQQARDAFSSALQRDAQDAKALFGLGLAEIRLGNIRSGQQRLQAASDADPNNALILTYLGRTQQQLGQVDAAAASWRQAEQADPKDPMPWLYQAQADLQANQPAAARANLQEAQQRLAYRNVYRSERLLKEDQQVLQANLAETQRQQGMEGLAFQTLDDGVAEKTSATLRNQADVLQGQRFGESARRSLLLQSLFNERPGNLPSELDIYGDGAGLTGAQTPQHGAVSELDAQRASYNNYDELFSGHTAFAADGIVGSQNTSGKQVRLGSGSDTLGVSIALRDYKTDGTGPFPASLNNKIAQGIVQWRPGSSTQVFLSYQTFHSLHSETTFPWDPINYGTYHLIEDNSSILRLGLRQTLSDNSELRGLISRQQTDQTDNNEYLSFMSPYSDLYNGGVAFPFPETTNASSSKAHSAELQYRMNDADSATQWGVQLYRGPYIYDAILWDALGYTGSGTNATSTTQQVYVARQQTLSPKWVLDAHLAKEAMDVRDNIAGSSYVQLNRWLPQLGLVYTPNDTTHARLAAWRDIGNDTVGDATLAPATVAGFVIKRPGERNLLVSSLALGADKKLSSDWLLDGQAQRRFADYVPPAGGVTRKQTDEGRLALHWQPGNYPMSVSVASDYEYVHVPGPTTGDTPATDSVQEQRLRSHQLDLRWFASAQWTVHVSWSHNLVSADMQSYDLSYNPILMPYQESFDQTDASMDWQFNKAGSMNVGVRNAADKHFQYTNLDPLNPRFSPSRLVYVQLKLAM